jgi:hypothetical protein
MKKKRKWLVVQGALHNNNFFLFLGAGKRRKDKKDGDIKPSVTGDMDYA